MKKCSCCKETKSLREFVQDKRKEHGVGSRCKKCHNAHSSIWYQNNKEQARACITRWKKSHPINTKRSQLKQNLKRAYGITIEEYDAMLMAQGGLCLICHTDSPGGRGRFNVDHDHDTGKIRGLLCQSCNIAIGHMREDPKRLRSAADYLEYHGAGINA